MTSPLTLAANIGRWLLDHGLEFLAVVFAGLAWRAAARGVSLQESGGTEQRARQRGELRQFLADLQYRLDHPPVVGFDYSSKPDLGLERTATALATPGLLAPGEAELLRAARGALLEVDQLFAGTTTTEGTMAGAFRQKFPAVRDRAVAAIRDAIQAFP